MVGKEEFEENQSARKYENLDQGISDHCNQWFSSRYIHESYIQLDVRSR